MAGIEEELSLDISGALEAIDELEEALGAAADGGGEALTDAFGDAAEQGAEMADEVGDALADALGEGADEGAGAVEDALGDVDATVDLEVDATEVDDAAASIDGLDADATVELDVDTSDLDAASDLAANLGGDATVDVSVDTGDLDAASDLVDDLDGTATVGIDVDTGDLDSTAARIEEFEQTAEVNVQVDAGDLEAAQAEVQALDGTDVEVAVQVDGADDLGGVGDGFEDATGAAEGYGDALGNAGAATGGFLLSGAALDNNLQTIAPGFTGAALATGGLVAALGLAFAGAQETASSVKRLNDTFGEQGANRVTTFRKEVSGLEGDLIDFTVATGSSDDALKFLASRFGEAAISFGLGASEAEEASQQLLALSLYVAASKPEFGTAEQAATKLARALATGGRAATLLGIPLTNAADIADAASARFNKPVEALSNFELQVTGAAIAVEELGPRIGIALAQATDDPLIALRSLATAIGEVIEVAGAPLVEPVIEAFARLTPTIEQAVATFGDLVQGGLLPAGAAVGGALEVLELFADVLSLIPKPLIQAGGAFLVANKGLQLLAPLVIKAATGLKTLAVSFGQVVTAGKFSSVVTNFKGLDAAITAASAKYEVANVAAEKYEQALREQIGTNAAAAGALQALTNARAAESAVMLAQVELGRANEQLRSTEAAQAAGVAGAEQQVAAAKQRTAAAELNLAAAIEVADAANADSVAQSAQVVAGAGAEAGALRALSTAHVETAATARAAGASTAAAGASAGGAASLIGPLGIALGVAAVAWFAFGQAAESQSKVVEDAKTNLEEYRDELDLTNKQLAALDAGKAEGAFQNAGSAADDFYDALGEDLQDDFARLGLDASLAGEAIRGSADAQREFRQALIDSGDVQITGSDPAAIERLTEAYLENGEAIVETSETGRVLAERNSSGIERSFEAQVDATEDATAALVTEAEAELNAIDVKAGLTGATDTSALATLAAIGGLDRLSESQQVAALAALDQADAIAQSSEAAFNFEVAIAGASGATELQLIAAQRAVEQLNTLGTVDPGDLGAARAIAASAAFTDLPIPVQDAITGLVEFGDAQLDAAEKSGALISATGEVVSAIDDLRGALADAVGRFGDLQGAQGRFNAGQRDIRSGIRGIDEQVRDLGPSLNDISGAFDVGAISAENYTEYLSLLSEEQRAAIENAVVPGSLESGVNDGETSGDALPDADKAELVRQAILGSAEAMSRANDLARDNADTLLDYFDTITGKIADEGKAALEAGEDVETVNARVAEQVRQFKDAAVAAGVSEEAVDAYLASVDLSADTGFELPQLDAAGVLDATDKLSTLQNVIASFPPEVQTRINALEGNPEAQVEAIQNSLNELPSDKRIAVQTALLAPDTETAQFAIDTFTNTPRAIQTLVTLGLDQPSATQALADIAAWNAEAKPGTELPVTIETATAVAAITEQFNQEVARATVGLEPGTEEFDAAVAEAEKTRDKRIELYATTGELDPVVARAVKAERKPVDIDMNVPGWARTFFGIDGAKQKPQRVPVELDIEDPRPRRPKNRNNPRGNRPGSGAGRAVRRAAGGTTFPLVDTYAAGGYTDIEDPDLRRALAKLDGSADEVGAPQSGRYGPGADIAFFGEDDTAGEYLISRKQTERDRNQDLVRLAAADLGVQLAPQVTVAPVVQAPESTTGAATEVRALLSTVRQLVSSQRGQRAGRSVTIADGAIRVVAPSPRQAADMVAAKAQAEEYLVAGQGLT